MRMILLSTLFALGIGFAGMAAVNAAPGTGNLAGAANATSLVQQAEVVIVTHPHRCRSVRVCHIGPYGGRVCHWERVCRRY